MEQNVVQLSLGDRLWAWFETNKKHALWGAVAVVVLGFAVAFYVWRQNENEVSAAEAFTRAAQTPPQPGKPQSAEAFLKIASEFSGTETAKRAILKAGALFFEQGKFAEAQSQFERFSHEFTDSPFLPQAMLGTAACLDAQGKADEAVRAYESIANRFPSANVVPQAQFALARNYESQGKLEQAWTLYEKIAGSAMNSSIGSEAGVRAEELRAKLPAAITAPSPEPSGFSTLTAPQPVPTNLLSATND